MVNKIVVIIIIGAVLLYMFGVLKIHNLRWNVDPIQANVRALIERQKAVLQGEFNF